MAEVSEIIVEPASAGERLDRFLRRRFPELSRAALAELVLRQAVRVNGRKASKGQLLRAGDRIEAKALDRSLRPGIDPTLPLRVLHEDRWLVCVDKPAGVPSHALRSGERGSVVSALLVRYPEMADVGHRSLEPGLLHRLDTDTSGILLAARDADTFQRLRGAHVRGEIDKRYLALCAGQLEPQVARAHLLADRRRVRVEQVGSGRARPIETEIVSVEPHGAFSLVSVRVAFAARHQVRAHLAALGHAIAGDALYGGVALAGLSRHFLHASDISLEHPATHQTLSVHSDLPPDLVQALSSCR
jgi:23S rRNA pseudouridine1911/1915/1917 synthase